VPADRPGAADAAGAAGDVAGAARAVVAGEGGHGDQNNKQGDADEHTAATAPSPRHRTRSVDTPRYCVYTGTVDFEEQFPTVGRSKTEAGEGRTIPLNSILLPALLNHSRWCTRRFGMMRPEWYLFPFGKSKHLDPTRPMTTLKTVWGNIKETAGIKGRWHDTRHTLVTELAESGAGDQTTMDIAGHVSRQMLARYSNIRMEAKRKALEAIVSKPAPAQEPQATIEEKPAKNPARPVIRPAQPAHPARNVAQRWTDRRKGVGTLWQLREPPSSPTDPLIPLAEC